jgi:hypothetical protein
MPRLRPHPTGRRSRRARPQCTAAGANNIGRCASDAARTAPSSASSMADRTARTAGRSSSQPQRCAPTADNGPSSSHPATTTAGAAVLLLHAEDPMRPVRHHRQGRAPLAGRTGLPDLRGHRPLHSCHLRNLPAATAGVPP